MIIEKKKEIPSLSEPVRFSIQLLSNAGMLYIHRWLITTISDKSSVLYDQRCLSSYDPIYCGSLYVKKEMGNLLNSIINKVGGVCMLALLITATATAKGMVYRKFTKNRSCV